MNMKWDSDKGGRDAWIAWMEEVAAESWRLAKPGAHALVWALPRTSHWTATAWENAGWEVRDRCAHLFGSGFPKSHNIGLAIDKMRGQPNRGHAIATASRHRPNGTYLPNGELLPAYAAKTPEAAQWEGWGTALKPAMEDWWLLRKPLSERTVAANVLRWGTAGLNIDMARVPTGDKLGGGRISTKTEGWDRPWKHDAAAIAACKERGAEAIAKAEALGRWPANVILGYPQDSYVLRDDITPKQRRELLNWMHENA
jgi:site-specific DNA-methyltransferase (adenine-specific)